MDVIYNNALSANDYCRLRKSVEWYDIPEHIAQKALEKSDYIITAVVDGIIIGMARYITDGIQAFIMDVIVHPDFQGYGIGKRLTEELKRHIENTYNIIRVYLTTHEVNVGFYEKLGFEKLAVHQVSGMGLSYGIE